MFIVCNPRMLCARSMNSSRTLSKWRQGQTLETSRYPQMRFRSPSVQGLEIVGDYGNTGVGDSCCVFLENWSEYNSYSPTMSDLLVEYANHRSPTHARCGSLALELDTITCRSEPPADRRYRLLPWIARGNDDRSLEWGDRLPDGRSLPGVFPLRYGSLQSIRTAFAHYAPGPKQDPGRKSHFISNIRKPGYPFCPIGQ